MQHYSPLDLCQNSHDTGGAAPKIEWTDIFIRGGKRHKIQYNIHLSSYNIA